MINLENIIIRILSDIKSSISISFTILDLNGNNFFGDDIKPHWNTCPINFGGIEFSLASTVSSKNIKDFSYFIQTLVNSQLEAKVKDFLEGDIDIEDFPFPCGVLIIAGESLLDIADFIYDLFKKKYILNGKNLTVFLPIEDIDELKETSHALHQSISEEISSKIIISIGGIAHSQKDLSNKLKDAKKALKFSPFLPNKVLYYPDMLFEKLLLSISPSERKTFKEEVRKRLSSLDHEALNTAKTVLESNLNMAEASRRLYVHRNTLMYRLDKIAQNTGLDLRMFSDAVKMQLYLFLSDL